MKNKEFQELKEEHRQLTERINKLMSDVELHPNLHSFIEVNQLMFMNGYLTNLQMRIDMEQGRRDAVYGGNK